MGLIFDSNYEHKHSQELQQLERKHEQAEEVEEQQQRLDVDFHYENENENRGQTPMQIHALKQVPPPTPPAALTTSLHYLVEQFKRTKEEFDYLISFVMFGTSKMKWRSR
jgi:hypothetical protein